MLGSNDEISHACFRCMAHPLLGIKFSRIERKYQFFFVLFQGDAGFSHQVFGIAALHLVFPKTRGYGVRAPMDEATEFGFVIPRHSLLLILLRGCPPTVVGFAKLVFVLLQLQVAGDFEPLFVATLRPYSEGRSTHCHAAGNRYGLIIVSHDCSLFY